MCPSAWIYFTHAHALGPFCLHTKTPSWQHDKFLVCLICLPKQETIHHQHCNVRAHIRDQRIRWDGKLTLLWEYICTCSDLKEQNTCVVWNVTATHLKQAPFNCCISNSCLFCQAPPVLLPCTYLLTVLSHTFITFLHQRMAFRSLLKNSIKP